MYVRFGVCAFVCVYVCECAFMQIILVGCSMSLDSDSEGVYFMLFHARVLSLCACIHTCLFGFSQNGMAEIICSGLTRGGVKEVICVSVNMYV
jgi:hypothetical protein